MWVVGFIEKAELREKIIDVFFSVSKKQAFASIDTKSVKGQNNLSALCKAVGIISLTDCSLLVGKECDINIVSFTPEKEGYEYLIVSGYRKL